MTTVKSKRKLIFLTGAILFLFVSCGFLYFKLLPDLDYTISTSKIEEKSVETPLEVVVNSDDRKIVFSITFIGRVEEITRARLLKNVGVLSYWPFIVFSDELTVQLYTPKDAARKSKVMYEVSGAISNLRGASYKLRVIDQYDNLIDETVVELEDPALAVSDEVKVCEVDSDCVPVSCECSCSGCGGFPYDDIVHKDYVQKWYQIHKCREPTVCLMVCCPPRRAVCKKGMCAVIELGELGEGSSGSVLEEGVNLEEEVLGE